MEPAQCLEWSGGMSKGFTFHRGLPIAREGPKRTTGNFIGTLGAVPLHPNLTGQVASDFGGRLSTQDLLGC